MMLITYVKNLKKYYLIFLKINEKIGLYLSVGPRAGGSFQYCLSVIKYLQNLDNSNYEIIVFSTNEIWKKRLNKKFKIVKLTKINILERILNYLNIFIPSKFSKFLFNKFSLNIRTINNTKCDYILFPSQENLSSKIKIKSITTIHDLMHIYEKRFKNIAFMRDSKEIILIMKFVETHKTL